MFYSREVARPERVELPTFWFVAKRSIQLSYGRAVVSSFNYTEIRRQAATMLSRFCSAPSAIKFGSEMTASSLSSSPVGMAAQLSLTNGRSLRGLWL